MGLLRTILDVGGVTVASFSAAIPSSDIFPKAQDAGTYFKLVSRQDQAEAPEKLRSITQEGNQIARGNIVTVAHYMLHDSLSDTEVKCFELRVRGSDEGKVGKGGCPRGNWRWSWRRCSRAATPTMG